MIRIGRSHKLASRNDNTGTSLRISEAPPDTPMSSVTDRHLRFLTSGDYTDLTLLVGKARTPINVHKMVMILGSPYFEEKLASKDVRLQSDIAEAGSVDTARGLKTTSPACAKGSNETLVVEDVEPDEFNIFLKFIYGGVSSIKVEEAMPLLVCGTKFKIPSLVNACALVINRTVDANSALTIFKQALHYKRTDLVKPAMYFICKNAYKMVDREDFRNLPVEGLHMILQLDELQVYDEMQLFEAVLVWAKAECERRGMPSANPTCLRSALGPVLKFIRFPQMSPSQFALKIPRLKILTSDEVVDILPFFHVSQIQRESLPSEFFISKTRNYHSPSTVVNIVKRLNVLAMGGQAYPCGALAQTKFKVNKCVWIKSVGLSPSLPSRADPYNQFYNRDPANNTLKLGVKAEIRNPDDEEIIFGSAQDNSVAPTSKNCIHVEFKKPVRITADVWYLIVVSIDVQQGQYNSYLYPHASNGRVPCESGVIFEFQNTDNSTQQGRQIPELGYQLDD